MKLIYQYISLNPRNLKYYFSIKLMPKYFYIFFALNPPNSMYILCLQQTSTRSHVQIAQLQIKLVRELVGVFFGLSLYFS